MTCGLSVLGEASAVFDQDGDINGDDDDNGDGAGGNFQVGLSHAHTHTHTHISNTYLLVELRRKRDFEKKKNRLET